MRAFFSECWVWMLVPFVGVVGGLGLLYFLSGGSPFSDFVYDIF